MEENLVMVASNLVLAASGICMFIVALIAYSNYKKLNVITVTNVLYTMDKDIYNTALRDDSGKVLKCLYYDTDSEYIERYSVNSLNCLLPKDKTYKDFTEIAAIKTFYDNTLCGDIDTITDNGDDILRWLVMSERMLYLVYNAYEAYKRDMVEEDDWHDYSGLLNNYGSNILFLCAIYIGHKHGYFSVDFAKVLQKRLNNNKIVMSKYPEMLKDKWIDELAKRRNLFKVKRSMQ